MAGKYAGFQSVKLNKPKRSSFDLSHDKRLTTRMGRLTPVVMMECVPSDYFDGGSEVLLRLAPLLAPIYDQIELYVHYFFVPNRLIWEDWEEFITGGRLGVGVDPLLAPVPPFLDIGEQLIEEPAYLGKNSLADYLGVPIFEDIDPVVSNWLLHTIDVMPFGAFYLCWYEYYRDRNFVADNDLMPLASGEVSQANFEILAGNKTRSYMHDYFTSALPFTQRGEEVLMPLAGSGFVNYRDTSIVRNAVSGDPEDGDAWLGIENGVPGNLQVGTPPGTFAGNVRIDNIEDVEFDASSVSINDFRAAYALQVWLERNAVGGSRYTESTQAHFGVRPQDSRLQRPEYIGGGRIPVKISEIVSTAWSNDGTADVPLANMAGHGVTYGNTNRFRYFCTEHGFIVGIASIMNPPSYQQGLPRMFRRRSFLDYPWPTFAKLGEQEVFEYEIYARPTSLIPDLSGDLPAFGYQSRYADWKYVCSSNHGEFRDTLLFWTLTRVFATPPVLSNTFVQFDDATQNRIFAVPDEDNFWLYVHNRIHVKRALPYFGTPNTLGFGS